MANVGNIRIDGARLIFKNFEGRAGEYNAEGARNFGLLLSDEMAEDLKEDGWNVKYLEPKDGEGEILPWLPVKVKYGKIPPLAVLVTSRGKTRLDEETIGQLDWTRAENIDIVVRPYSYPAFRGCPEGIAAYLKSIFVTVQEDDLEIKYADIPYLE